MYNLSDVYKLFPYLQRLAKQNGYVLSLYGSVLEKGFSKNDLDLVAYAYVDNVNRNGLLFDFCKWIEGTIVNRYNGNIGNSREAFVIENNTQTKRLDLVIINDNKINKTF